jgi:DNA-binding NarL/FixJ family response regulator
MLKNPGDSIKILIVDDHPVVRTGLTNMLGTQSGFHVIGAVATGQEAIEALKAHSIDLLLLDLRMPGMNGIETLHAIKKLGLRTRVIVLTSFETDEDIYRAVHAGAEGYLLKNTSQVEMVDAIRAVSAGNRYIPRHIASRALEISSNTVRNHVNSVIEKLEVSDRTEAATTAIQRGIIEVDE